MNTEECFNILVERVHGLVCAEYNEDRFENALTDAEKHWARTVPKIRKEFGVSDTVVHDLSKHDNRVYLGEYVKLVNWFKSLVPEERHKELVHLVADLMSGSTPPMLEKKPRRKKQTDKSDQSNTEK